MSFAPGQTLFYCRKKWDVVLGLVVAAAEPCLWFVCGCRLERFRILMIGWHPRHSHEDEDEEDGAPEGRLTLRGRGLYFIVPGETESLYPAGGSQSGS